MENSSTKRGSGKSKAKAALSNIFQVMRNLELIFKALCNTANF